LDGSIGKPFGSSKKQEGLVLNKHK
jgi:hypothetical protein